MVAFTCNACGGSVKKSAVEKHYYHNQCPQTRIVDLTCIDCLQDFNASNYGAHIRCLTENEKYGAKGTVERSNNKGEVKQQDWLAMIADVFATHRLDPKHKQILGHILNFDNIPRKKKPFLNFMKSSARGLSKNEAVIESLYDILDKEHKSRMSNAKTASAQNGTKSKSDETNNCDETPLNDSVVSENPVSESVVSEKKKKRRHKNKSESREESATNGETSQTELGSENHPPTTDESNTENGDKNGLSKKEKKEKKKREKYLTELNEIEKYEKAEEVNCVEEEISGKKKKEKKNRNKSESEMEAVATKPHEENGTDETSSAIPLERKLSKKEKKRKISENAAAEVEAKKKHKNLKGGEIAPLNEKKKDREAEGEDDETQEFIKPNKFKIDNIVRIILQSAGGEIALKRLAKRVCTEYQIRCGVQDSDYIMAKFQKKIYNIPGVKILKDKATLSN